MPGGCSRKGRVGRIGGVQARLDGRARLWGCGRRQAVPGGWLEEGVQGGVQAGEVTWRVCGTRGEAASCARWVVEGRIPRHTTEHGWA